MSLELTSLRDAVARHGRVARVVVAEVRGSAPREPGAAMLVWAEGASGTIGGGALELAATDAARAMLEKGGAIAVRQPLGPALGQCCGGAVTLVTEVFDAACLPAANSPYLRRIEGAAEMPAGLASGPLPAFRGGWFAEATEGPARQLWIWGAGHVGRALVGVLAPLPDMAITWVDTADDRFPEDIPAHVTKLAACDPALLAAHAPEGAEHLILTYSHGLDFALCHALLTRGFARTGLIGSATKWARFRSRLARLGHAEAAIARIDCPIGDPRLGKSPQAIAIGVAAAMLARADRSIGLERAS